MGCSGLLKKHNFFRNFSCKKFIFFVTWCNIFKKKLGKVWEFCQLTKNKTWRSIGSRCMLDNGLPLHVGLQAPTAFEVTGSRCNQAFEHSENLARMFSETRQKHFAITFETRTQNPKCDWGGNQRSPHVQMQVSSIWIERGKGNTRNGGHVKALMIKKHWGRGEYSWFILIV